MSLLLRLRDDLHPATSEGFTLPFAFFSIVSAHHGSSCNCLGNPCGWVHPCDGDQCKGHDIPVELVGDGTAIWWGWSNSGDNCELIFTVHYQ